MYEIKTGPFGEDGRVGILGRSGIKIAGWGIADIEELRV